MHLSQEVNNNALPQQPAREQVGATKGSGAVRDVDIGGQEAVAQPRGRGGSTGVQEVAEIQTDGRGQRNKRLHDNQPEKNRGEKGMLEKQRWGAEAQTTTMATRTKNHHHHQQSTNSKICCFSTRTTTMKTTTKLRKYHFLQTNISTTNKHAKTC